MPPTMTGPPPTPQRSQGSRVKGIQAPSGEVEHFLASLFGHLCWLGARVFLAKLAAPLAVVTGSQNQHSGGAHRSRVAKGQGFRLRGLHKFWRWNKEKGGQPTRNFFAFVVEWTGQKASMVPQWLRQRSTPCCSKLISRLANFLPLAYCCCCFEDVCSQFAPSQCSHLLKRSNRR